MALNIADLPDDVQAQIRALIPDANTPRSQAFRKEDARKHAIKALAAIANLTQDERRRTLEMAMEMNKV